MATPFEWVTMAIGAVEVGMGVYNAVAGGEERSKEEDIQAEQLKAQMRVAEGEYSGLEAKKEHEISEQERTSRELTSSQRARMALSGAEGAEGSPLVVMTETTKQAQEDLEYTTDVWNATLSAKLSEIRQYYEQYQKLKGSKPESLPGFDTTLLGG